MRRLHRPLELRLTHIGGPTTLIEVGDWRLLTDPTFDPGGRLYYFGRGTASRKVAGPALPVSELGRIDAVLLSHDQHADNLDDAGRALLPSAGVVVTTAAGARRLGRELEGAARGLKPWQTTTLEAPGKPAIEITATPCRHGGRVLTGFLAGRVIGFALGWEGQEQGVLWISGDTVLFDGIQEVADRLEVETALIHLGDVKFPITGPVHYTLSAREAIEVCRLVKPRTAIPIHYEGWSHFCEGREAVERELAGAPEEVRRTFRWLEPGVPAAV